MPRYRILQGDVIDRLKELPSESVHCAVTSPPYWGLRDYGTANWEGGDPECAHKGKHERTGGYGSPKQSTNQGANFVALGDCACGAIRIDDQIGLEQAPEVYVAKMVAVFSEVRRVLRRDGTLWLNLGDSYAGSGCGWGGGSISERGNQHAHVHGPDNPRKSKDKTPPAGMKNKDLIGIPWMTAFALRADGWFLRSDIIWAKPNPMPESVTDRPTKSHEYIFLLTKRSSYYFDQDAVREPLARDYSNEPCKQGNKMNSGVMQHNGQKTWAECMNTKGRNLRSVWRISTEPYGEAHFATFPKQLVERCIKAGTSEHGVCAKCGASWKREIEKAPGLPRERDEIRNCPPGTGSDGRNNISGPALVAWRRENPHVLKGWQSDCGCNARVVPAVVLDPFSGSGTTGVVANNLGRDYIGIELNPEYVAMSERRLFNPQPSFMDALRDEYDLQSQQGFTE